MSVSGIVTRGLLDDATAFVTVNVTVNPTSDLRAVLSQSTLQARIVSDDAIEATLADDDLDVVISEPDDLVVTIADDPIYAVLSDGG